MDMDGMTALRVHVAPLGFEVDRIVLPLKKTKADRLWLIIHDNVEESRVSDTYQERIERACKKEGVEVGIGRADRMSLFATIRKTREIIEGEEGNSVFVNVSSGSKIQAIACMMACMVLNRPNVRPFYAEPDRYAAFDGKQQSFGLRDMHRLSTYELQTPKPKLLEALRIIASQDGQRITKKEMARLADERGIIKVNASVDNYSQARFASLDKNIIAPLEREWGFVSVEKIGRTRWIGMTDDGRNAAEFLA
ncbi:conserved hypothetical protein [Nitrosopumilaceae archaeon]|nr:DUF6293 family protein [Nitrosopumilus sp.]CAI9832316.1 conserved hypothetical protein [Nitrosopumilaceae archaeon]MDA7945487.1 DUF6293 family protein [Nitrosopumilus sp.]MDA7954862.1 DUF6293 family protein [Nitrosopumilus sp.]MDA7973902.1 DUF6293 family protein [Nitrosopumilus sp.]